MRLYAGSSQQFIMDTIQNQIADKLRNAFFNYYRFSPSPGEVMSWRNSLRAMSHVLQYANLSQQIIKDKGVSFKKGALQRAPFLSQQLFG